MSLEEVDISYEELKYIKLKIRNFRNGGKSLAGRYMFIIDISTSNYRRSWHSLVKALKWMNENWNFLGTKVEL